MVAASSSSVASATGSYDVFINFRGEDIRKSFIAFLYKIMNLRGINAFLDNEKLWIGEAIGPALHESIKGSKISIPVFSKGYADSKWCLQELAEIIQCHRSNNQIILPIFFFVDPSDVRNQTGTFEKAFLEHQKKFEPHQVESWRQALRVVGNLKGEVLDVTTDQAEVVELVVKRALRELVCSTRLVECKYPIDMDSRVNDILSLLNIGSNDVQFLGICGFGGIGKTTLAKAVYNNILSTFDNHCFLSDVREQAAQFGGLVSLQKQFLKDIFKEDFDIRDLDRGKILIEERVRRKKIFLVLDDVDSKEQIDALVGKLNWFDKGSRVIITTRDEHILNLAKVNEDKIYRPQLLDHVHSLQLFSWHAFQNSQPPKDYMLLSHDVVYHSGGLPLILEVFGSYLLDISDKDEWECTLKVLKEIPPEEVQRRLRISYDNLEYDYQKDIFLDAACFFIGWKKEIVTSIWEACGFHPKSALSRLIKRSLLKFDGEYLMMHDQIRDMGRQIVLEESRKDPSKRSRLWSYGDIVKVLRQHKETDTIEGMSLIHASSPSFGLTTDSLELMPNLRVLNISFRSESYTVTSFLLSSFYHRRLVYLKLSHNSFNQLWNVGPPDEHERFQKLKILNHSYCCYLLKSPNFSWFPSLEQLDFEGCESLDELDESIGQLSQLKSLILKLCTSLKKLPDSICDLETLEKLDLSETIIEKLPDNVSRMCSLKELILLLCKSLKTLPEPIGDLKSLVKLDMSFTEIEELPDSISRMTSLKELILKSCGSLKKLPKSIGDLKSLVKLYLSFAEIEELPDSISKMTSLKELILKSCESLKKLPESIGDLKSLVKLDLSSAEIEELPDSISRITSLKELILQSCFSLKKLPDGVGLLKKLELLDLRYCITLVKLPRSFGGMRCLDRIQLEENRITDFHDDFSMPPNLVELEITFLARLNSLPTNLSALKTLKQLKICQCAILEYIPALPSCLVELHIEFCGSLVRIPDLSKLKMSTLKLRYCEKLEEIHGLEEIESLYEFDARGSYKLTHTQKKIQGRLSPSCTIRYSYSLTANQRIYNSGFILCLVLDISNLISCTVGFGIDVSACIHQKDKKIICFHSLMVEHLDRSIDGDVIYICHFKGFDWCGVPLHKKDAIEILDINTPCSIKFCKFLFKNGEVGSQKPCQNSITLNWSYMDDDGGVITLNYWPDERKDILDLLSCIDFVEEEMLRPIQDDEAPGPSLSLGLTCWPRMEVEGSKSLPNEKQEEETTVDEDEEAASFPSLTLALNDDGSTQQETGIIYLSKNALVVVEEERDE